MTAQMAQSSVGRPSDSWSEVFSPTTRNASSYEAPAQASKEVAAHPTASCPGWLSSISAGVACAPPTWKCPNDSRTWIASAKSASRDPCLTFDRNHFMPARALSEGSEDQ